MAQVGGQAIISDAAGAGLCLHPPGCCPGGEACSAARSIKLSTAAASQTTTPPAPDHEHQAARSIKLSTAVASPTTTPPAPDHEHQAARRPLTIVYGDRACTVDVTEAQAMKILSTARLGTEQSALPSGDREDRNASPPAPAAGGSAGFAYPPAAGLAQSMKGSLRRFLEKRAARLRDAAGSPYSTAAKLVSPPPSLHQGL